MIRYPCCLALAALLFLLRAPRAAGAAETGDFDGDGRITLADIVRHVEGLAPAAGSLDGFELYPPIVDQRAEGDGWPQEAGLTYLELLRRSVPDSLPHSIHLIEAWNRRRTEPGLPVDPRISLSLDPLKASGGSSDRSFLTLRLETSVRLRAFLCLIENGDGILRVPMGSDGRFDGRYHEWFSIITQELGNLFVQNELRISAPHAAFLISRAPVIEDYGVSSIPRVFLIGPGGEVAAKDLRDEEIVWAVMSSLEGDR